MLFNSKGKLLITGEYLILKGAKSLALATNFSQSLEVNYTESNSPILRWKSIDKNQQIWFECSINLKDLSSINYSDESIFKTLQALFLKIKELKPSFFSIDKNIEITTSLDFDNSWGLGTSSTLISNLSKWSGVNAFDLLRAISKGSGYDIAVGLENHSVIYQLNDSKPNYSPINFSPSFKDHIFFLYLGSKQKSETEIDKFYLKENDFSLEIERINQITELIQYTQSLKEFELLLTEHEQILSKVLKSLTVKQQLFDDYNAGIIKSLGAWGGDFCLVTVQHQNDLEYFTKKGYDTILTFDEMIYQ